MTITIHRELEQGTEEWRAARCGIITASVMGQLITPTLKVAANAESRAIVRQLVAERITGHVEDSFLGWDMVRGMSDEPLARDLYASTFGEQVTEVGLITREVGDGWTIGYSPDGLVAGDGIGDGLIEIKSRVPKHHLATILEDAVPREFMAQIQTGLFVSGRDWCDFISYCGGMPMWTRRVMPDPAWRDAILQAVETFELTAGVMIARYHAAIVGLPMTERTEHHLNDEIEI